MFEQAQVLHDCLARKQHMCMQQCKLNVQVEHLLCQTDAVICLGDSYASCTLQSVVSIKSLPFEHQLAVC